MTDEIPADRVAASSDVLRAVVEAEGARIASLRIVGADGARDTELLLTTPWAGDPDGPWSMANSSHEWHRRYRGGWHVLIPRAGDPVTVDGVEQPFHGEAAWRTWRLRAVEAGVDATVLLRTVPLRLTRRLRLAGGTATITQELTNVGAAATEFGWVEHPAFDGAVLEGASIALGDRRLPVQPAPGTSFADVEAGAGICTVLAPELGRRLVLRWDSTVLPRLQLWQERRGTTGFPWWGAVDAVGIEPAADRADGRVDRLGPLRLAPGATLRSSLTLEVGEPGSA